MPKMAFITATLPFSVSDTLTVLAMAQALDISAVISQDVVGSWPLGRDRGTSLWGKNVAALTFSSPLLGGNLHKTW